MAQNRKERFDEILRELRNSNSDIEGAVLVTPDGLLLANQIASINGAAEKVAAVSASLLGLGKKVNATLENGTFQELHLRGSERSTLLLDTGKALLTIIMKREANVGMVYIDARIAAEAIAQAFV